MDIETFKNAFLALLIATLCFGIIGGIAISSLIITPAWRKSARMWRSEALRQKKYTNENGQGIWDAEQIIARLRAEKNAAVEMLAPLVLENESLRNKLREAGIK